MTWIGLNIITMQQIIMITNRFRMSARYRPNFRHIETHRRHLLQGTGFTHSYKDM